MSKKPADPDQGVRLCLVAEARDDAAWIARVETALDATAAVTLVLAAPDGSPPDADAARPLVALAHRRRIAALLVDDAAAARAAGADGVHLTWRPDIAAAYATARAVLGPRAIVGADAGSSRHDAMTLGEAGTEYVAFGRAPGDDAGRAAQAELVAWWAELFVVPVVAFGLETAEDAAELARLGADFIAIRLPAGLPDAETGPWARAFADAVRAPADAT